MAGLGRTYFDANIFIYAIETPLPYAEAARSMVERLMAEAQIPVTSEYTLAECLVGARKARHGALEDVYITHFANPLAVECHSLTRELLIEAARLAGDTGMRLADTIHIATAVATGCQSFVTNDRRLKLPASLSRISLLPIPPAGS
jgi:predicted nucleic acid-binding protein